MYITKTLNIFPGHESDMLSNLASTLIILTSLDHDVEPTHKHLIGNLVLVSLIEKLLQHLSGPVKFSPDEKCHCKVIGKECP